ncbi:MAG: transposase [Chloroflexi bacterium]|nr:transposase [Chloroflexota bacterium]
MYRKNPRSAQPLLLTDVNSLPAKLMKRLHSSWATTFREEVFQRIDEDAFAVLYSEKGSRPNTPVNVLVGLEILKEGRHWSDEELYDHFCFDLQVRYALGCDVFGEEELCLRTLYNFRRRVVDQALSSGENLFATVFEQVTDSQMAKLKVRTEMQRLDSTMILSNIADLSRLELLVEVLQRLWRLLNGVDRERYKLVLEPYVKESAGQYVYRLKGREVVWEHISQVGQVLYGLLRDLADGYGEEPLYAVAKRFFDENFVLEAEAVRAKANAEIGAGCLQSLDDLEASYRKKGNRAYKGYVAHIAETCHPANPVQLIDQVQVAPNQVSDVKLLQQGLPGLQERLRATLLVSDGAYASPELEQPLRDAQMQQITSGLTGTLPDHKQGRLAVSDFSTTLDARGEVTQVTCPAGKVGRIEPRGQSYGWSVEAAACRQCPLATHCPTRPGKTRSDWSMTVSKERARSAHRRRMFERHKAEARNLRTAVEATIFQLKHGWARGKVRVRGRIRVTMTVLCSALAVNLRRIDRYLKDRQRGKLTARHRRPAPNPVPTA